jgi:hypothetical protein
MFTNIQTKNPRQFHEFSTSVFSMSIRDHEFYKYERENKILK